MDHRFKACIGFARLHGYTFEFFELLENFLDKGPPLVDFHVA
jgi:hypothetical protein